MLVTEQKVLRRFWHPVMPLAMLAGDLVLYEKDILAFDRAVAEEDRRILEATDPDACIDTTRRVEFHIDSDRPGLLMRKKRLELLRSHGESEVHN